MSDHPTQADEELGALLSTWAPHAGANLGATVRPEASGTLTRVSPALRTELPSLGGLPQLSIDLDARAGGGAPAVETVSDFALGESLGEGGMGRVFIARQRSLDRDVAVKTVHERLLESHGRALIAEGVVTGKLEHPNITPVHAVGLDVAGRPVIVMKRIQGVAWSELIADASHPAFGRLGPHAVEPLRAHVEVLISVCNALHFAHSRGVVHRDVKPENVMIGEFGEVYLVDWGVALDLRAPREAGGVCGTPSFLAPEMVYGDGLRIDERTDVYLLGATLHVLLTGRPRHDHANLHDAVFSAYVSQPHDYALGVPEELGALANHACARKPTDRPRSVLEFRGALLEYLEHESSRLITREGERRLAGVAHASEAERTELLTEARFAFAQALREWPDDAAATRGLDRCLALMIERALAVDDLLTARALAAQHRVHDERWSAEFRRVEARLAERARGEARLEAFEKQADVVTGATQRARSVFVMLAVAAVLIAVTYLDERAANAPTSMGRILAIGVVPCIAALAAIVYYRREGLATPFGRHSAGALLLVVFSIELHRLACYFADESSTTALRGDLVLLGTSLGITAFYVTRWWLLGLPIVSLALVALHTAPRFGATIFGATAASLIVMVIFGWRAREREQASAE